MSDVIYLYGFVPQGTPPVPRELTGIAGGRVELLEREELGLAITRVAAERYGSGRLEDRVRDLDWMAARGVEHERVVTWFVDHASILPVRVLTLYSSIEALERDVIDRAAEIDRKLRAFEGLREWDLKVSYELERLGAQLGELSEEAAAADAEIDAATPGRRYLLEKRRARRIREEAAGAARRAAYGLMDDVEPLVRESKELSLPHEAEALPVVLNAAFLVEADREADLWREVQERSRSMEPLGIHIQLSGPWAPYRFVEEASGRAGAPA